MFLRDPWYWPEIWYKNPQVQNPHLIYPGDVLAIIYVGGQKRIQISQRGEDGKIIVYNSGTSSVRKQEEMESCFDEVPGDERTALFRIDVIEIPVEDPSKARIVDSPAVFADPETGALAGLWRGGDHGDDTQETKLTNQCHDITVFPDTGIAAGACSGNGIIFDISNPLKPQRKDVVLDKGFAYWHSATFNNDGTKVLFTDEWGGGSRPRCRAYDPLDWGADAIYDIVDGQLEFRSYFKMPAPQVEEENCVAHNGSIVPVPGRDIFVQAWYQGGISVIDFTDSANPVEIAYFDRGPVDEEDLILGGFWSTYWYNGRIYGTEIVRGLDESKIAANAEAEVAALAKSLSRQIKLNEESISSMRKSAVDPGKLATEIAALEAQADTLEKLENAKSDFDRAEGKAKGLDKDLKSLLSSS